MSEIICAKGLARGLVHKDSTNSRSSYGHFPTQQAFTKPSLHAAGPRSFGSGPALMQLTEEARRGTVTRQDNTGLIRSQHNFSEDRGQWKQYKTSHLAQCYLIIL